MKKGLSIGLIIFLLTLIIGFVFYKIQDNVSFENTPLINCIPENTEILIQLHHPEQYGKIINNIPFADELNAFQSFIPFKELAVFLDSSFIAFENIGEKLKKRQILISIHRDETDTLCWLFVGTLKTKQEEKELLKIINYFPDDIHVSCKNGIVSVSNSLSWLNESLKHRNSGKSLLNNQSFSKIFKNDSGFDFASIYLNFNTIRNLMSPLFSSLGEAITGVFSDFGDWCGLDLDVKDVITLNGFITGKDNKLFSSIFSGINPQKSEIYNIIPKETKFALNYAFDSKERFKDNYVSYIKQKDTNYSDLSDSFKQKNEIYFEDMMFSFIEKEMALVYTKQTKESKLNRFLVIDTKGQSQTLEILKKDIHNSEKDIVPLNYIVLDEQTKIPVYEGFSEQMIKDFLKYLFPNVPCKVFSFYRNYLVFSENKESLESFMYSALLNRNLLSYPYFSTFVENFSFYENLFLFVEVSEIFPFIKDYLSPEVFYPTNNQEEALSKFYGLGVQMSSSGNFVYTTLALNHVPTRDEEPHTVWQSRLDSTIVGKPALVENHNTGEKEILVQDALNNLYLINSMGRILWKKPLDGQIMSDFSQIDYYKNGKFQYLFNTANRIYLIDRNGNHVANYPVLLPQNATNGLSVYDYDKNKEYRIFIALADNTVYLFDKTGNRNPGWNPPKTEGKVTQPIQFFTTGGRDYVVFGDQFKNYILDRRGAERVKPNRTFIRNEKSLFYLEEANNQSFIVTSTQKGELAKINLQTGACSISNFLDETENHFFAQIKYDSGKIKYLTITNNNFRIFSATGNEEVNIRFNESLVIHADIYRFSSNDIKFGIIEKNSGKIHLLDGDGKNHKGFPLKGASRFSIGFMKSSAYKFNLIVGGEYNFLNNYAVE